MPKHLTPELLEKLRYIAKIESIGSSMRLAGSKLSDREVEQLLARINPDSYNKYNEHDKKKNNLLF